MAEPAASVLMSVYNGEAHVAEAIRSILIQTASDFEFLVVDDASTDGTREILRSFRDPRLRIVRNDSNLGLTASLNRGLQAARGAWVVRQDADDLSHPERLARQFGFLAAQPGVAAVGSQAHSIDALGRSLGKKDYPIGHRSIWWAHLFDNALVHSAVTFRKAAVLAAGGYDEKCPASQDYELWSRLGERHALANLPDRLVTLRILPTSVTRTHRRPELIRKIQSDHAARLFPGRVLDGEELQLLGQYRSRVKPVSLKRFLALFHELREAYHAAWPETRIAADFCRTLALQYERIGYNLLPVARGEGLRQLAKAVRTWPPRLAALPWIRIAALTLFGDLARRSYERFAPAARSGRPAAR